MYFCLKIYFSVKTLGATISDGLWVLVLTRAIPFS